MRYPAPLLSVGFSPSGSGRVAGSSNGVLFVGKRRKDTDLEETDGSEGKGSKMRKRVLNHRNFRYFSRGQNEKPAEGDFVIKRKKTLKFAAHDKLLRKFRHKDALVSALNGKNQQSIVVVTEELVTRKKLLKCVTNLDVDELGVLLGFLHRYLTMPRYAGFLMGLAKKVLQLRAVEVRKSDALKRYIRNLNHVVEEVKTQHLSQEI